MYDWSIKKQRGLSRKYKILKDRINDYTSEFPAVKGSYWNMKVPCNMAILESKKIRNSFLQDLIKHLIKRVDYLNSIKPSGVDCKIVACIFPSNMWSSELTIFFNDEYYKSFFKRDSEYQTWEKINDSRVFINQWNLDVDDSQIEGYKETVIGDDGETYEQEIWIYSGLEKRSSNIV